MASREAKEPLRTMFVLHCSLSALPKGNKAKGEHEDAEDDSSYRVWAPLGLGTCLERRSRVVA